MRHTWRAIALSCAVLAGVAAAAGCTSPDTGIGASDDVPAAGSDGVSADAPAAPTGTPTAEGTYGVPPETPAPEPAEVAIDPPTEPAPVRQGTVFITWSGWDAATGAVQVGGYLAGAVESDGTCTLTLSRSGTRVTATAVASPDVSTTSCGELSVPGTQVGSGAWQAVVSYRSSTSDGTSESVEVTVP